jgi:hypothetical protein
MSRLVRSVASAVAAGTQRSGQEIQLSLLGTVRIRVHL